MMFLQQLNRTGGKQQEKFEKQLKKVDVKNSKNKIINSAQGASQSHGQQEMRIDNCDLSEEGFDEFIKGIPQECVRQMNLHDFGIEQLIKNDENDEKLTQNIKQQPKQLPTINDLFFDQVKSSQQQIMNENKVQQISGLSSISQIDQDWEIKELNDPSSGQIHFNSDEKGYSKGSQDQLFKQFLQNQVPQFETQNKVIADEKSVQQRKANGYIDLQDNQIQFEHAQNSASPENDDDIPYNAGYGSFLREMSYWAKDVSFQDQTHDIWTPKYDHQNSQPDNKKYLEKPQQNCCKHDRFEQPKTDQAQNYLETIKNEQAQNYDVKSQETHRQNQRQNKSQPKQDESQQTQDQSYQKFVIDFNQGKQDPNLCKPTQSHEKKNISYADNGIQVKDNGSQDADNEGITNKPQINELQIKWLKAIKDIQKLSFELINSIGPNELDQITKDSDQQGKTNSLQQMSTERDMFVNMKDNKDYKVYCQMLRQVVKFGQKLTFENVNL